MTDIEKLSATETARLIREKQVSAAEVMQSTINRIEKINPKLNAFIFTSFDEAMENARQADKVLAQGDVLGPLHGVPIAMKDLFDFKPGWPSSLGGIPQLKNNIAEIKCGFVERMESAGAIFVGKTNSPAMGYRGTTDNVAFGPTSNPFDTSRNAGGSSGGSAAAVASGMVALAEGTDGGGSIRIPAAWTNTVGYRASAGRTPLLVRPNAFANTLPYIFEGTITRNVEDAILSLGILQGAHPGDPNCHQLVNDFSDAALRGIKGMKIGFSPNLDVFPVENEVSQVINEAIKVFETAGAHVEEIKIGLHRDQREYSDVWCRLFVPIMRHSFQAIKESGLDLLSKENRHGLSPDLLRWVEEVGPGYTADDLYKDLSIRSEVFDAYQATFSKYDLIISPTVTAMPVKNTNDGNTKGPSQINGIDIDPLIGWCPTFLTNFTGHPSVSVPAGLSASGLPVGLHIVGRRQADGDVLAASAVFERLRPWVQHYARISL
ncbi:amidase [Pelagibaculum spongiae]|uniref:Amidase n=1 Tax=Pelagibaculum spongiae TaxID=2080658 RepID=A0A2V1GX28_9GAMM|nr:amidase [Pelagibaculum spongiae]PVZ65477.1 amidase [Pelagibaculum spongiae]